MIVRDTEAEAKEYADTSLSKLDDEYGKLIRDRAHDSISLGVAHQAKARELADQIRLCRTGSVDGVGRARSGCGAALVGSPIRFLSKSKTTKRWASVLSSFSGYPHIERRTLWQTRHAQLKTCSLPHAYGRVPAETPATPLGRQDNALMNACILPKTYLSAASSMACGAWAMTTTPQRPVQAKIEACLAQGHHTMDQADIYGGYEAEEDHGQALKAALPCKDQIEIVTKCDIVAPAGRYSDAP